LLNEYKITWAIDKEKINKLYRELSNIIHGKYDTFETSTPNSFDYNKDDFKENLRKVVKCENIIISCLGQRFPEIFEKVKQDFPSLTRYNNVY
jgi:rubrerythrin